MRVGSAPWDPLEHDDKRAFEQWVAQTLRRPASGPLAAEASAPGGRLANGCGKGPATEVYGQ